MAPVIIDMVMLARAPAGLAVAAALPAHPFVTERLDARGPGLGPTVPEGIIAQHGGVITASNRPQGGACLEISLPAAL
jgi:C4-dicarboxylate-specific signal transduction histidine kinase